jgi:hypothetical protein
MSSDGCDRSWRSLRLQPKTAFSRFPTVHRADLEGQPRVEFTRSPSRPATPAFCAKQKCKVFKSVALNTRIKGQTVDLSPTHASGGTEDWRVVSTPFQFSSRSDGQRGVGAILLSFLLRSVGASGGARVARRRLHFTKNGSSAASLADCD